MRYKLFQCYDLKAEQVAGPIMIFPREAPAIRHFQNELGKGEGSYLGQYPSDYILLHIGTLDEQTGRITAIHDENGVACNPEIVATGKEWVDQQQPARPRLEINNAN